jgi:arabinogalactan oligomer/maltooligosaccharide transport system permease protein
LGTSTQDQIFNEELQIYEYVAGDNSLLILLFSIVAIAVTLVGLTIYIINTKSAYKAFELKKAGKKLPTFGEDIKELMDKKFHIALLALPMLGLALFTVLPTIFMILLGFTNYDRNHQPPGSLFGWVGFSNFSDIFYSHPMMSSTFAKVFIWTVTWAFFATFSNYVLGMIVALMINKKGIRFKKLWRTVFVTTIAIPQFVSLFLMRNFLNDSGTFNVILQNLGVINGPIHFLTNGQIAKIVIIFVNIWVGVPYTILITTGILMNIPADLYESASIDGANVGQMFAKITLPYMLFITGPYLITQFVGNINNFNVIYLLTGGGPLSLNYYQAGETDLLVTWLYRMAVNEQTYSTAAVVGLIIFIVMAVTTLAFYNVTGSAKREEEFQ